jgi:hypothetical protein
VHVATQPRSLGDTMKYIVLVKFRHRTIAYGPMTDEEANDFAQLYRQNRMVMKVEVHQWEATP